MSAIPGHMLPPYSDASREDALFHYTTASGLNGIFESGVIWSTAYYCANDESELAAGKGVIQPLFRLKTAELIRASDPRVTTFYQRGVDILEYADKFEQQVSAMALSFLCTYITCFCKPNSEDDFQHGLLSQWRGYGIDGGYALQFSRKKLLAAIESTNGVNGLSYKLQDVHYTSNNTLKEEVLAHKDAFVSAYMRFLDELAGPLDQIFNKTTISNPVAGLQGGPLEAYLDYLVQTKNRHFNEERECRLSFIQPISACDSCLPVAYFNRGGLLVPYIKTPSSSFNVLDCIEWIIVGPAPRLAARVKSVTQLVKQFGRDIKVRPSHTPFTRL